MEFVLSPELVELKKVVRRAVKEHCIPLEPQELEYAMRREITREEGDVSTAMETKLTPHDGERLKRISKEIGVWDADVPAEFGGGGMGYLGMCVINEEIRRSIVLLPKLRVPNNLYEANENQKQRFLYPVLRAEKRAQFAQTEPGSGSDVGGSMKTLAVRDGDEWVINGTKMFISHVDEADFLMLLALNDPEKRQHGGITMFLVDMESPGISYRPIRVWDWPRDARQFFIYLDNVRVPHANVLGEVGSGFRLGQRYLAINDRLERGPIALGILTRALEMAVDWAKQRITFGQPLSARQAIQWMLVDVYITIKCVRGITYECAYRADHGQDVRVEASLVKFCSANWAHQAIDKIVQIFGGLGETLEMPTPHWYHILRHARIGGGTDEIHRRQMARAVINTGTPLWEA